MATPLDLEEQEQLDQIKHFWKTYGNLISWLLIAILGSYAAWNGYQYWERTQATKAAALYDEVERAAHYENLRLPEDLDYNQVTALSFEVRQRLSRQRPETLGQASRLSGITPAAISLLLIHLKRSRVKGFAQDSAASNSIEAV